MIVNADKIIAWICTRVAEKGNCIGLETWLSGMKWVCKRLFLGVDWRNEEKLKNFCRDLKKKYPKKKDGRKPFKIYHIISWMRKNEIFLNNLETVDYDLLVKACIFLLAFFTMSRPAEMFCDTASGYRGIRFNQLKRFKSKVCGTK